MRRGQSVSGTVADGEPNISSAARPRVFLLWRLNKQISGSTEWMSDRYGSDLA